MKRYMKSYDLKKHGPCGGNKYMKSYSRTNLDKLAMDWLDKIGITNKIAVEIGAGDGWGGEKRDGWTYSNIRMFEALGWSLVQFDCIATPPVIQEMFTQENINDIFAKHQIPPTFDLLSIDIDGNDYWIWKALEHHPRVVIIEFNTNFATESVALKYDPNHKWNWDVAYGASFVAMKKLGELKGYTLVECVANDLIFVKRSELKEEIPEIIPTHLPLAAGTQKGYDRFIDV